MSLFLIHHRKLQHHLCSNAGVEVATTKVWENTTFDGDATGERKSKFLKLMGFKGAPPVGCSQ